MFDTIEELVAEAIGNRMYDAEIREALKAELKTLSKVSDELTGLRQDTDKVSNLSGNIKVTTTQVNDYITRVHFMCEETGQGFHVLADRPENEYGTHVGSLIEALRDIGVKEES